MPPPPKTPITDAQAAADLKACKAPATDDSSQRIRAGLVASGVNSGYSGAQIADTARLPVSIGLCVADLYSDKKPTASDKAGAWIGGLMDSFKTAADKVGENVSNKIDASLKAAQPGTASGVTERGASMDQFCATVEANGGSARDVRLAEQKCEGPKAKAHAM